MKGKKITIISIVINIILICSICNIINKINLNKKHIIKEMTETEYESNITSLNQAHEEYIKYIEENKKNIASAITEMGVETSIEDDFETIISNIKDIKGNSGIHFDKITLSGGTTDKSVQEINLDVLEYTTITIEKFYGYAVGVYIYGYKDGVSTTLVSTSRVNTSVATVNWEYDISEYDTVLIGLKNPSPGYYGVSGYLENVNIF